MKVNVVVSTMNGIIDCNNFPEGNYELLIVNQGTPFFIERKNTKVINTNTFGLSNSRNLGVKYCSFGDVILFTDNDVRLHENFENDIISAFMSLPVAKIITFKVLNRDGTPFKRNYKSRSFEHNIFSSLRVSSIEIAIRLDSRNVLFDTDFGLGANIPLGEENIFVSDAIKSGISCHYFPTVIATHEDENHSGALFDFETTKLRFIVFKRIFGVFLGVIVTVVFILKNILKYK